MVSVKFRLLKGLLIFFFLFSFLIISKSYSQTVWAPVGAKWTAITYDGMSNSSKLTFYTSDKDTNAFGKICKKIEVNYVWYNHYKHTIDSSYGGNYLMSVENEKIYYYFYDTLRLLYDFSLNKGDTLFSYQFFKYNRFIRYIIDSTDYIQIAGKFLKRQYLHPIDYPYYTPNEIVIERIGTQHYLFGEAPESVEDMFGPFLECYSDSEISYSKINCDSLISIDELYQSQKLQLYPNPTFNELILNYTGSKPFYIEITNSLGIKMMEQNHLSYDMNNLDVGSLEPGVYFLILMANKTRMIRKFIKY
jgi:hypothetical protein